jgi:ATP-dependent protease HslVU peptidase subunit
VLQVAVHDHHEAAAGVLEPGVDGRALAAVAGQEHAHQVRVGLGQFAQDGAGGVRGAVVDHHDLVGDAQGGQDLADAAVELAQEGRSDKMLRRLEAMLICADAEDLLVVSGNGEVISPDDDIAAIGSGGSYALAAARALKENTDLPAVDIAKKAIAIAGQICIFTNDHITVEEV